MSELPAVYIACASGNNPQTDVAVRGCGDLIQLLGHPQMTFTPNDALALARTVSERAYLKLRAGGTGLLPEPDDPQQALLIMTRELIAGTRNLEHNLREMQHSLRELQHNLATMIDDGR